MAEIIRLTDLSHGAGCGCKLGPSDLTSLISQLVIPPPPEGLLVGNETGDDAAVWKVSDDLALIATLDFFTPIVDDPYDWGRIAATNAMSDVFAMGGTPFLGLNVVNWPADQLPLEMLGRVLQGGIDVATEAGIAVAGGHSITDAEPKYGMVVLGTVHPDRIVRNSTARPGDRLFLTKPLGLGIIATAHKRQAVETDVLATAVEIMTTSNGPAAGAMSQAGSVVSSATDITGFGLLGHLYKMMAASGCAAELDASAVPVIDGVMELASQGMIPGGTKRNLEFVRASTDLGELDEAEAYVLADAQTSGGMLIATSEAEPLAQALKDRDVPYSVIGDVVQGPAGAIEVTGRLRP